MKHSLQFVREIANLERYSLARANAGLYYNVIVGPRLQLQAHSQQIPHDPSQWIKLLTRPLTWLIQKHPSLSVVVGEHLSTKPTFLRMRSIDISRIIRVTSIQHPSEIANVVEQEHARPFDFLDVEVPLWRMVVVHVQDDDSFFLLYVFQHVIGDGRSGMALTEQLVQRLNVEAAEEAEALLAGPTESVSPLSTVVIPPEDPLPLPLEMRVNCSPSWSTLVKEATMSLLLPGFVKKAIEKKYWSGEVDATLEVPHETQAGMWFLTPEETSRVTRAAKAHSTTVQSILYTASVFAAKAVFLSTVEGERNQVSTTKDEFVYATPVSLRPLISPSVARHDQGGYVSEVTTRGIRVELDTEFWEMTAAYRKQVIESTTTAKGVRGMLEHVGLLDHLPTHQGAWEEFLRGLVTKEQHGRGSTLMLSNLGKAWEQEQPSSVAFRVQDGIFSQSGSIISGAVTLNAATANGVLSMIGTWQKATFTMGRERGEQFLTEFKRILLEATESERISYRFQDAFHHITQMQ
ncbi:hypothetical protein BG011_004551 [Mortierella polycephala]|uniref:Alcohol acetyltransferase n=1 Tax=Mortierella polycephala TaxID=41804 RepID=A0A9P6QEL1_9FUNG|nr:hypothetical protein BG011_004551 [Mortierella polycephala]